MSDKPDADDQTAADPSAQQRLSGPGAGLGATGRTADEFDVGDAPPGGDYNDPGGIDTARDQEQAAPAPDDDDPAG